MLNHHRNFYIGIMSGTSLDGIDVAIVEIDSHQTQLIATMETPYEIRLKNELETLINEQHCDLEKLGILSIMIAEQYADVVTQLLHREKLSHRYITLQTPYLRHYLSLHPW